MPALPPPVDSEANEACPVCKQTRYLNPKMTFKVNPECYHRMCDSCIDRIFMSGPASCPIAGCNKTLRRARFRKQTFDDLAIERECDIRRDVNNILNKREGDFETLRDYNDYLQTKEDLTWNLIYNTDVEATRKKLAQFKQENKEEIANNKALEQAERNLVEANEDDRRRRVLEAQEDLRRELAEERNARERESRNVAGALLSSSGDPDEAVRQARAERVVLKKSSAARSYRAEMQRKEEAAKAQQLASRSGAAAAGAGGGASAAAASGHLSFAGLKKAEVKPVEGPYDPFGGLRIETQYFKLRDGGDYTHFFDIHRKEAPIAAGGYDVRNYYSRAVFEAHAGLGVIMSQEKAAPKAKPASTVDAA